MDLQDLVVFQRVARDRSISRAAAGLRLAQPSISTRIQNLEGELGQPLFLRTGRGVQLTPAGERFLPYVERCLSLLQEAREAVQAGQEPLRLRMAAPASLAETIFPRLIPLLVERGVAVWVQDHHSAQVLEMLLDGRIDAGLSLGGPRLPGISQRSVLRIPILCVARPDHPLAALAPGRYGLAELVCYPLALYRWGKGSDDLQERLSQAAAAVSGGYAAEVAPGELARRLVLEQGLISFLPRLLCAADLDSGALVALAPQDLPAYAWEVSLIYRERKLPEPALAQLLDVVDQLAANPETGAPATA